MLRERKSDYYLPEKMVPTWASKKKKLESPPKDKGREKWKKEEGAREICHTLYLKR